ncbi:DUF3153 domain-containing protein [Cyanobium sp. NIES-981]|uniref:DUF3153 domain-containing protein n=1 Tax=Cyanobium sp. NIES-981 TaxID=1851505 RepID=UPI001CEDCEAC|nr:DUF3153 domain-containing protein [Cyanobium sp. NIES-981]
MSDDPFREARQRLERGDYGQVLRSLEPLVASYPPASPDGAQLQLLMATAWMGQGNTVRAMACCRQVKRCSDATLRAQARDLLEVLEAPALERPRHWSLTLPDLGEAEPVAGRLQQLASRRRRQRRPPPPPPPPVGPTRPPLGFAAVALALLLLTVLLGGCGAVHAELTFHSPGRLQVGERLVRDPAAVATPWEQALLEALRQAGLRPTAPERPGVDHLVGPVLPAGAALQQLGETITEAGRLAGLDLPAPRLQWEERNWLVGVRQHLVIGVDLRRADPLPGADFSLDLSPLAPAAVRLATPRSAVPLAVDRGVRWPLQLGADNRLDVHCWRWNPLGLGALAIGVALLLALLLARLRQQLGFGLPQLPA